MATNLPLGTSARQERLPARRSVPPTGASASRRLVASALVHQGHSSPGARDPNRESSPTRSDEV